MTDRQTPLWRVFALAAICLIVSGVSAAAETLYVDASNTTGVEDGTAAYPYSDINSAVLAAASGDTVRVAAGTYNGDVVIDSKALRLIGADPALTTIRGTQTSITVSGTFTPGSNLVEISGFTITGGGSHGVAFASATVEGLIHNCIMASNHIGVLANQCGVNADNNVFSGNTIGIEGYNIGTVASINNIFYENETAIYATAPTDQTDGFVNSSYGLFFNNTTNFSSRTYYGSTASSNDVIGQDPLFVDIGSSDYRLQTGSPCIDTGSPLSADNDPDGTRNDKGVYGGPGAAGFWPTPAGSPVVTELSITPHDVPLGGTLTITAKGTAR